MKNCFVAIALALVVVAGGNSVLPIATPAYAGTDPFDDARHYIVNKQNAEALRLIESGDFPLDQGNYEGWTLLHYAAESGNLEMVKLLLQRGADPTLKTKYGSLPYEVASGTMIKAAIAAAVEERTGLNPMKPAPMSHASAASAPARSATTATASKPQSAREKMCQQRWYSSNALCSDSTCKMREYRKWQTCLKTGSYY